MRIARPAYQLAALVAVGATVLAACGTSSSNNKTTGVTPNGAFGKVPAATGTAHAGTLTFAFAPGTAPT
jgi:hypothetical protein